MGVIDQLNNAASSVAEPVDAPSGEKPRSPVPSLRHVSPRSIYDFETAQPVYSAFGVPTRVVRIYECPESGVRFRMPPSREESALLHAKHYQDFCGAGSPDYEAANRERLAERVKYLQAFRPQGRVLDVGCSTGLMMSELTRAGFEAFGCDVSSEACAVVREQFGAERVCHGDTKDARGRFGESAFDIITLMDVIEHFHDAAGGLRDIHSLLKPGGLVFLRTPSLSSPFFRLADWSYRLTLGRYTRAVQTIYHAEHIYFFSEKGLRMLLEESGLSMVSMRPDPLSWRVFRVCELVHGPLVNATLALVYFVSRAMGGGHGINIIAQRCEQ
ncbi:MAG TPA: class I SAM-dependent methyltransferase [Candidatus Hydrogenedentes bacterium]|nr:class I SAM-dependent methyltransferase [Candidatus Hydrogenedentota bacterium]HNT88104.1 class I SAM-dependent methyltransferase [Candidatus Hydrogenedentota bacterium]